MTATKPTLGIDVSHYQGAIDWHKVAASGVKFAYVKATEGATMHDDHFAHNRIAARAAGVMVGAYHFYHYDTNWSDQAHAFCGVVGHLMPGELPPVLDLEQDDYRNGKLNLSLADAQRRTIAWIDAVHARLGVMPIIYADRDFIARFLQDPAFARCPLWIAAYTSGPPIPPKPWSKITLWQYNEHGNVPGIGGDGTDMDRVMIGIDALKALAAK